MAREIQINPMSVRTMQVIVIGLVMGVVMFLVVSLLMTKGKQPGEPFMAYFAAVSAGLMIVLRFSVPSMIAITQIRQMTAGLDVSKEEDHQSFVDLCTGIYQTTTVIGCALLEGAAFFNIVAYISAVQTWSFAVVGVLVAIMLITFPSEAKVTSWIRHQLDVIEFQN